MQLELVRCDEYLVNEKQLEFKDSRLCSKHFTHIDSFNPPNKELLLAGQRTPDRPVRSLA